MGMFDFLNVNKQVLENVLKDQWKPYIHQDDTYYDFQTKDLENALFNYYIEADNELYIETYAMDDACKLSKQPRRNEPLTQCVSFYDVFDTPTHRVILTLQAKIIDGCMHEVFVESAQETCLKEIQANTERNKRKWDVQEATWEMRVFRCMQNIEWKINCWLYPIVKTWHGTMQKLRLQAEARALKETSYN